LLESNRIAEAKILDRQLLLVGQHSALADWQLREMITVSSEELVEWIKRVPSLKQMRNLLILLDEQRETTQTMNSKEKKAEDA
jgi:hypothetical protein